MRRASILFTKIPEPDFAKTRLIPYLGEERACTVAKLLLKHTMGVMEEVDAQRWISYIKAETTALHKEEGFEYFEQVGDNIGDRMAHAMEVVFEKGYDQVILFGSDLPTLSKEILEEAFCALDESGTVIGPSPDGGYYLIGANREAFDPCFFRIEAQWSTEDVYYATRAQMEKQGRSVAEITPLHDLDTKEDALRLLNSGVKNEIVQFLQE